MTTDLKELLRSLSAAERELLDSQFIAPCVAGGRVRTRIGGLVYSFAPKPEDFEGWAIFVPLDSKQAEVLDRAELPLISRYLSLFKPLRVRLAFKLRGSTWLSYPVNESDARQRTGGARPVPVHLVSEGDSFEQVIARADGGAFWYEEPDRRSDPILADRLREEFNKRTRTADLRFKNLTPEARTAYDMALRPDEYRRKLVRRPVRKTPVVQVPVLTDEDRLRDALELGGAELRRFRERGDCWTVEWTTRTGERHSSAISKQDLTVVSSGICLSGRDRDFDLASLVGVIEARGCW